MGVDGRVYDLWAQTRAFALAVAVHLLAAVIVLFGTMDWKPFRPPVLTGMTIEAVMVDTKALERRREEEAKQARLAQQRKAEKARRAKELKERQEREARKKREAELRLQQLRKKQEAIRQARLKKQQEELEKVRKQREKAERERKIEEEKLKQLEQLRQAEKDKQERLQAEADLQRQMAAEQSQRQAQRLGTLRDRYIAEIQAQVTNNWLRPPTARPGLRCTLRVVQIPGGEVISAAIAGQCNADEATRRSLVAAVERAGTLPYRGFEDVFQREIDFIFRYDGN
jgi:colicin import membrane protein